MSHMTFPGTWQTGSIPSLIRERSLGKALDWERKKWKHKRSTCTLPVCGHLCFTMSDPYCVTTLPQGSPSMRGTYCPSQAATPTLQNRQGCLLSPCSTPKAQVPHHGESSRTNINLLPTVVLARFWLVSEHMHWEQEFNTFLKITQGAKIQILCLLFPGGKKADQTTVCLLFLLK